MKKGGHCAALVFGWVGVRSLKRHGHEAVIPVATVPSGEGIIIYHTPLETSLRAPKLDPKSRPRLGVAAQKFVHVELLGATPFSPFEHADFLENPR